MKEDEYDNSDEQDSEQTDSSDSDLGCQRLNTIFDTDSDREGFDGF